MVILALVKGRKTTFTHTCTRVYYRQHRLKLLSYQQESYAFVYAWAWALVLGLGARLPHARQFQFGNQNVAIEFR